MLLLWQSATPGKMQGSLLTKGFGCPTPVLTSTANLCGGVREQPRLTPQSSPKAPGSLGQPSWEMKVELPDTEKFAFCLPLSPTFMQDKDHLAPTDVVQWVGHHPANCKVPGSIPGQGTCLGCRPGSQLGTCERQPIDVSLPIFFPPFPSL